jgi:hypothetical protein
VGIGIKKGKTIDKTHAETCEFLVVANNSSEY